MNNNQIIRGLPFPLFPKQNIIDALDYIPRDGDIVVASYPKTGTTWLQYIVLQLISKGECFPTFDDVLHKTAPFIEYVGIQVVEELKEPRIYKHHCPYNMVQKNPKAKYLYTYRNPEDTFISYFHFMKQSHPIDFEKYYEGFLSGSIGYGRYFEHVLSYWEHKDDGNLLLVSYEQLLLNRKEEILKIAKFLGESYYHTVVEGESVLEKIMEHTSFEYMRSNVHVFHPRNPNHEECLGDDKVEINFFRKGVIGDGKQSLSRDHLKRLRDVMENVLKGTSLLEEWM